MICHRNHGRSGSVGPRSILLFVLVICVGVDRVSAQVEGATSVECPGNPSTCLDCVTQGCGWFPSTGTFASCLRSCGFIADAPCYGLSSTLTTPEAVCTEVDRVRTDTQICANATKTTSTTAATKDACQACTSTVQSDGITKCQWFPELQSCSRNGFCNLLGCGTSDCDASVGGEEPEVDVCPLATNCTACLVANCAWTTGQGCTEVCDFTVDIDCFTTNTLENSTPSAICALDDNNNEEGNGTNTTTTTNSCTAASESCTTCTSTLLADGVTSCQWYIPTQPLDSAAEGICCDGSSQCSALGVPAPSCESLDVQGAVCEPYTSCTTCLDANCAWASSICLPSCDIIADIACYDAIFFPATDTSAEICDVAAAELADLELCFSEASNASCEACTSTLLSDRFSTCAWSPSFGDSPGRCCTGPFCDGSSTCDVESFDEICARATTCEQCLETICAWSGGQCSTTCLADTSCFRVTPVPAGTEAPTVNEICASADTEEADTTLCFDQPNCAVCTQTIKSDGLSTCQWYAAANDDDGSGGAYCGTGTSCDVNGICGSTTCGGDDSPTTSPCDGLTNCDDCLDTGCGWATSFCIQSCRGIADITCYDSESFPNITQSTAEVCAQAQVEISDLELCLAQTSCSNCTSIVLSDGETGCQWFAAPGAVEGTCCTGANCFLPGPGTFTCDDVPEDPCATASSCVDCLESVCAWALETCLSSCDEIADAECLTLEPVPTGSPPVSAAVICDMANEGNENEAICSEATDCGTCTTTTISGGTCRWFEDESGDVAYCSANSGCDMNGICGSSTCGGDTPSCDGLTECDGCLESGCAWADRTCIESCRDIADVTCYSAQFSATSNIPGICATAQADADNEDLCFAQSDCSTCTLTIQSDGSSACQWYAADTDDDGTGGAYCGTGKSCDVNGICGSSTCPSSNGANGGGGTNSTRKCSDSDASCNVCLQSGCAWSLGFCLDGCNAFDNSRCYSTKRFANLSITEICTTEQRIADDKATCRLQTNCSACVATALPSDSSTNCQWHESSRNNTRSFCGVSGCNKDWECGTSRCSATRTSDVTSTIDVSGAAAGHRVDRTFVQCTFWFLGLHWLFIEMSSMMLLG